MGGPLGDPRFWTLDSTGLEITALATAAHCKAQRILTLGEQVTVCIQL